MIRIPPFFLSLAEKNHRVPQSGGFFHFPHFFSERSLSMTPEQLATDLKSLLLQKDFRPVQQPEDTPVFDLYIRIENPVCCVLAVQPHDSDEHREDVAAFAESLQKQLPQTQCTQLICLYLTIGPEPLAEVRPLADTDRMGNLHHIAWHYATDTQTLQVADGSPDKLMGIEKLLRMAATGEELPKDTLREDTTGKRPVVTFTIFAICAALLLYGMVTGQNEFLWERFSVSKETVLGLGQYYRLITAMFFHGSIMHLAANSIYLFYFGSRAELLLGKVRYVILYLISGICGGLCSVFLGHYASIGASGAIFGLLGAMLILTREKGSRYTGMNYATMILLAFTALAMGFLDVGVDNWAHLGGFLSGALVFFLMFRAKE